MKSRTFIIFITLFLFMCSEASAKPRILTFAFNKPEFIELQYLTFKKFLSEDFELIVFNDASNPIHEIAIYEACQKHGIQCVRYEQDWHNTDPLNQQILAMVSDPGFIHAHISVGTDLFSISIQPSVRHCHVIQYALDNFGYNHDDIVAIMDADAFLMRPMNLRTWLSDCHIAGIEKLISQENVEYFWVVFTAIDMPRLPVANKSDLKFHVDVINQRLYDSGAHTYHFLKNNPQVVAKQIRGEGSSGYYEWSKNDLLAAGFTKHEAKLIKTLPWPQCVEFHMNRQVFHYAGSSFDLDGYDVKQYHMNKFLRKILSE